MKPSFEESERGPLLVWAKPDHELQYVIFVDAASGMRGTTDYSVIKVLECRDMREVACWRSNKCGPDQVASKAMCLGYHYNVALIGAETEKWGSFIMFFLAQQNYPNLYTRVRYGRVRQGGQKDMLGTELGWRTDLKTRDWMFGTGMTAVNEGVCQINSVNQLREMREIFRDEMGKPRHPKNGNDDEVMAWLGALMMRDAAYSRKLVVNKPKPPQTEAEKQEAWVTDLVREYSEDHPDKDDDTAWLEW